MSFAYTITELETNNQRFLLIGLVIGLVLLVLWGVWFLTAPITLYERSESAQLERDGSISTTVSQEILPSVSLRQQALFGVRLASGQTRYLTAEVTDINVESRSVTLVPTDTTGAAGQFLPGVAGWVDFAVQRVTPSQLVFQSANAVN